MREMDDIEVLEVGVIENVQRADLNPMEEANAYAVLMERFGRTQDALAGVVGKSRSHVANICVCCNCPRRCASMWCAVSCRRVTPAP